MAVPGSLISVDFSSAFSQAAPSMHSFPVIQEDFLQEPLYLPNLLNSPESFRLTVCLSSFRLQSARSLSFQYYIISPFIYQQKPAAFPGITVLLLSLFTGGGIFLPVFIHFSPPRKLQPLIPGS